MPPVNPNSVFKYRLKEMFIKFFGADASAQKKLFAETYKITSRTMDSDFNATLAEAYTIPTERLLQYAEFLNQPVETLRNKIQNSLAA